MSLLIELLALTEKNGQKKHYIKSNGSNIAGPFDSEDEAEAALLKLQRRAKPEDELDDAEIVLEAADTSIMKLNEIKTDPEKKFSYREIYGVTIHKSVMHSDWISRIARNPKKKQNNLHHTTSDQGAAYKRLENDDYNLINGWEASGKEFPRETDNKDGVWFERSIAVFAKPGLKGAVAVLPSGKLKTVTSKTWKPELKDFKE